MERKRGTFKAKLSEAPFRCLLEHTGARSAVFLVP
jgi:hypothetical protein